MMLNLTDTPAATEYATVYVAIELSKAKWKLGVLLPGSLRLSRYTISGGDVDALREYLARWRAKGAAAGKPVRIICCYEAGYDGHWLHRWLSNEGVINYEIDPASIQVNRRARRAKTDSIDIDQLMGTLLRYVRGEPRVCSMVRVPTPEDEDRRRVSRERKRLQKERTQHTNRISGLLHGQGIRDAMPLKRDFIATLDQMRTGDGRLLPPKLRAEIVREHERLCLVNKQLSELERMSKAEVKAAAPGSAGEKIKQLAELRGIGLVAGRDLVHLRQSPAGRQLHRYGEFALSERAEELRPGHQQGRQQAGTCTVDPARMAMAQASAGERAEPLVPGPRRKAQGTHSSHPYRRACPQADDCFVEIPHDRTCARRRRLRTGHLANGRAK